MMIHTIRPNVWGHLNITPVWDFTKLLAQNRKHTILLSLYAVALRFLFSGSKVCKHVSDMDGLHRALTSTQHLCD